jgi:exopolysaccharide biosynthesis operon protein EpsL
MHSKKLTRLVLGTVFFFTGAFESSAWADEGDAFHFGGGVTTTWDSNIFRFDSATPGGVQSDNLTNYYGLIGFDKLVGRQELYGDFVIGKTKFSRFSELDYDNQKIQTGWNGYFPNEIHSKLEWTRSQYLSNFADLLVPRRNVITADKVSLDLDVPVYANWHAVGGGDVVRSRNSNELDSSNNRDGYGVNGGVRYVTPYGNRLDLVYGAERSRFPDRIFTAVTDTAYRDQTADLRVYWQFSGSNLLEGSAGYISRDHETLDYRNFSGPSFRLADTWQPTVSTKVVSSIYRRMGAAGDNEFNYAVTKGVRVEPSWNTTAKIMLHGAIEWSDRRYLGSVFSELTGLPTPGGDREDKTWMGTVGVTYTPLRWMELSADFRSEHRDSNQPYLSYSDQMGTVTVQLSF